MAIPVKPMLAKKAVDGIPSDDDYRFETKWDGMRVIVERGEDYVRLWTRRGKEVTDRFPELCDPKAFLRSGVFDGEIVCFDKHGKSNFRVVVGRRHNKHPDDIARRRIEAPAHCMLFDCLRLDNQDLTSQPWFERRRILETEVLNRNVLGSYMLSGVTSNGIQLYEEVKKAGLEGIMAKHMDAPYYEGKRRKAWLKIKLLFTEDVLVTGFTCGQGKREGYFGSLIIISPEDGSDLGNVGTGFTDQELSDYMTMFRKIGMRKIEGGDYLLDKPIPAEVRHMENTVHGKLREPVFMRFRIED